VFRKPNQMPRRPPSDHQKRIRFLTVLSVVIVIILMIALMLLANLSSFNIH